VKSAVDLAPLFQRIPMLRGSSVEDFTISLLTGYSNQNFRLQKADADGVLRVPRPVTNQFIDRNIEAHNQDIAYQLGFVPSCVWREASGLSLTTTIHPSAALSPASFENHQEFSRIIRSVRKLHKSGLDFHGEVDLAALLNRYSSMLSDSDKILYRERIIRAMDILKTITVTDKKVVPSHNDLVLENMIVSHGQLWLIDWEYSAMASPYWDLATICNAAGLKSSQCKELLKIYCEAGDVMEESLFFHYRELLQLLNDCWMTVFADQTGC
jgi:thiamine kinase-like enzyme